MGDKESDGIRRGDHSFLLRLGLVALATILLGALLFGAIDRAKLGDWASRGFLLLTAPPEGD